MLNRPDLFCTKIFYWDWLEFIDTLLPNFQIILTLPEPFNNRFPDMLSKKPIKLPQQNGRIEKKAPVSLPSRFIQLIQVDGRMPNLALMKLSRYFKNNGKKVLLTRGNNYYREAESVFASCIFNFNTSMDRLDKLRSHFSDRLTIGGAGIYVDLKLEKKIENLDPDYQIYPELGDRAIGFITRGCPNKCFFALFPIKREMFAKFVI